MQKIYIVIQRCFFGETVTVVIMLPHMDISFSTDLCYDNISVVFLKAESDLCTGFWGKTDSGFCKNNIASGYLILQLRHKIPTFQSVNI